MDYIFGLRMQGAVRYFFTLNMVSASLMESDLNTFSEIQILNLKTLNSINFLLSGLLHLQWQRNTWLTSALFGRFPQVSKQTYFGARIIPKNEI